jgi:hypothetical protein
VVQPSQPFKTAPIPPNINVTSTEYSLPSSLLLSGGTRDAETWPLQDTHSVELTQPALSWNTTSNESFYNFEGLQLDQLKDDGLHEIGNATSMKTQPAEKRRVLEPSNWQHISSTELKPHESIKDNRAPRKTAGRRHGRLKPKTAKGAQEMRHIRACLPCSILKVKVS